MMTIFHIAAQYLATVSINFLEAKEDDSHTNLGWNNRALHTHSLSKNNDVLSLDYQSFSLILTNDLGHSNSFPLDGKTHFEIVHWIRKKFLEVYPEKEYEYKLHYELPYPIVNNHFVFYKPSKEKINQLIQQRNLVQKALEETLKDQKQNASIRIWPHHFDSGSFFMIDEEVGIGLGMAMPDEMIHDFYFYVSGYRGHDAISLSDDLKIKKGRYYNEGWKGIALAVSGITVEEAITFYQEAIQHYISP